MGSQGWHERRAFWGVEEREGSPVNKKKRKKESNIKLTTEAKNGSVNLRQQSSRRRKKPGYSAWTERADKG